MLSAQTTQTRILRMNTVKLFCLSKDLSDVMAYMMKANVKYYPVRRSGYMQGPKYDAGYRLEMEKDHPVVSFLILKFDLKTLSDDSV